MNIYEEFQSSILNKTFYKGIQTYKNPMDAWTYQEIIHDTAPDVIIEIGNKFGGSILMLKNIAEANGYNVKIIAIDLDHSKAKDNVNQYYNDIKWMTGDAGDGDIFLFTETLIEKIGGKVMVIEDSAHTYDNTMKLLNLYSGFVTKGCYYIVEDTIINHGLSRSVYGKKSAHEAVKQFMSYPSNQLKFEIDKSRERPMTWNPNGFLLRK